MENPFDQVRSAVWRAKETLQAVDCAAGSMADLLVGRLRHVDRRTLAKLKRELRDFNIQTKKWAD